MGFLKRIIGGADSPEPGPDWARPMSRTDAIAFEMAVGAEIERRGLTFAIGEGMVRVERNGRSSDFGLTNLAQVCHQVGPEGWGATIASHFDNLFAADDASAAVEREGADLEAVRSMLKVRLFPDSSLGGMDAVPPVSWEFAPGIVATFVYDLPTTVSSVNVEHINRWGLSRDELLAIALENVRGDTVESQRLTEDGASAAVACFADHFFAASHAFLLAERLPQEATNGAVFSVPHRHALLYAPIVDLGVVGSINQLIPMSASLFQQGPGSISPALYWWRAPSSVTLLPSQVEGNTVQFAPPDDFVQVLNSLSAAP
ncbi:MAG TPA: hypothetical protein VF364_03590 [Candidatus Limnocylindria bacterium]